MQKAVGGRPRWDRVARPVVPVMVAVALLISGCGAGAGRAPIANPGTTVPAAPTSAAPRSTPVQPASGFGVIGSTSFVTPQVGWAVVGKSCEEDVATCTTLLTTTDGGQSWRRLGNVAGLGISKIAFANLNDGYGIGTDAVYATEDGGMRWSAIAALPSPATHGLIGLAATSTDVVVAQADCAEKAQCNAIVRTSQPGSPTWVITPAPTVPLDQVIATGNTIYLRGTAPGELPATTNSDLWRSTDRGESWAHLPAPCHTHAYSTIWVAGATAGDLAAICVTAQLLPRSGGAEGITISTDGGNTYGPVLPMPSFPGYDSASLPAELALPEPRHVVDAASEGGVLTTIDKANTWKTTVPEPNGAGGAATIQPDSLQFENPTDGQFVQGGKVLWVTRDAGVTWLARSVSESYKPAGTT